jgi:hypothetical protein
MKIQFFKASNTGKMYPQEKSIIIIIMMMIYLLRLSRNFVSLLFFGLALSMSPRWVINILNQNRNDEIVKAENLINAQIMRYPTLTTPSPNCVMLEYYTEHINVV